MSKQPLHDHHVPVMISGIIDSELGEETVLFHPKEMSYYGLNDSATLIWQSIDGKNSVADITEALVQHAPDHAAQVREEVLPLISELWELGFIEIS